MIYSTKRDFLDAPQKRIAFIGMSGLGKTYISTFIASRLKLSTIGSPIYRVPIR